MIAVIGGRDADKKSLSLAEHIGKLVALNGWQLLCGGLSGIMEAASKGASSVGGTVVGILPGGKRSDANPYISVVIASGIGIARNTIIAHSADAAIAIAGGYGTLSEIAFCLQLGKPVVAINSKWRIEGAFVASSPEEAISIIKKSFEECEKE